MRFVVSDMSGLSLLRPQERTDVGLGVWCYQMSSNGLIETSVA